jgi:hypothetical protein
MVSFMLQLPYHRVKDPLIQDGLDMMEKRKIPASATNKTLVIKPEVSNFTE